MYFIIETKEVSQSINDKLLDYVKENGYMLCTGTFELVDGSFDRPPSYIDVTQAYDDVRRYLYVKYTDPVGFKYIRDEVSKTDYTELVDRIKRDWATPSEVDFLKKINI